MENNPGQRPHDEPRRLDLAALKALSHPLRVELLDALSTFGPQTASGLAGRLGESSGSTSYHLRQLAKHGLVEEVPDRGSARERWWRRYPGAIQVAADPSAGPSTTTAVKLVARQLEQHRAEALSDFLRFGEESFGEEWLQATVLNTANLRVDAAQLGEISQRVLDFLAGLADEYRDRGGPDARPVQLHFNAFPVIDPAEQAVPHRRHSSGKTRP
ncbi:ArsR/SmtB family transcription factor [Arthrobacter halodurans]|jgi:DNA-binding transcriptional ArsR family regulator|uniref:ArsR/SmtB family transcription factor n=1 Tax=Arthrobacter halodurans TaxID=516699 RepID=A0ABV4UJS7_9MICC